jgi:hypothetical protein
MILIDLGSLTSFISQKIVDRLCLPTEKYKSVRVKVANGEIMVSAAGSEGGMVGRWPYYNHTMRVLDSGAYDAILDFDWLRSHSPMECD